MVDWISAAWIVWEVVYAVFTEGWVRPLTRPEWIMAGSGIIFGFAILFAEFRQRVAHLKEISDEKLSNERDKADLKRELVRVSAYQEGALPEIARRVNMISVRTTDAETRSEIASIRDDLANVPALRPQIVYDRAAEQRNKGDGNLYTHLYFRNQPNGRAARDVTARIIWTSERDETLFVLNAKWQEVPFNLGRAIYAANRIDLLSDNSAHALDLCIRATPDAAEFYALDVQSPNKGAFVQERRLQPGFYDLYVELSCDDYAGNFRFRVQKDGHEPLKVAMVISSG